MVRRTETSPGARWVSCLFRVIPIGLGALLAGCASPGQPRPPSLRLPQVVQDLSAGRVGDAVHLRWTTPSATTDNLPVPTEMSAVICRRAVRGAEVDRPCTPARQLAVKPGPAEIDDVLPPALTTGATGLLSYRIEVRNGAGRSAGRSAETFAASGAAPAAVEGLAAKPIRGGVRLEWRSGPATAGIELERTDEAKLLATTAQEAQAKTRKRPLLASSALLSEIHLSAKGAGERDAGGTIDQTALKGATYRYRAQRVETAVLDGHPVALRSVPSATVTVKVLNTFPPEPPTGLETAPGGAETLSIDLSWQLSGQLSGQLHGQVSGQLSGQPGAEFDVAGYNVYRREIPAGGSVAGSWQRLNSAIIPAPAFHDAAVRAGTRYAYRVTAVDGDGNESAPGNEVQETPGSR